MLDHYICLLFIKIPVAKQARDAEEREDNAKRELGQQNVAKERMGVIVTFR